MQDGSNVQMMKMSKFLDNYGISKRSIPQCRPYHLELHLENVELIRNFVWAKALLVNKVLKSLSGFTKNFFPDEAHLRRNKYVNKKIVGIGWALILNRGFLSFHNTLQSPENAVLGALSTAGGISDLIVISK